MWYYHYNDYQAHHAELLRQADSERLAKQAVPRCRKWSLRGILRLRLNFKRPFIKPVPAPALIMACCETA